MADLSDLATLQARAVEALRQAAQLPDRERTRYLREVATTFVDAREHFFTREGEPDYRGSTYAYRTWVRDAMSAANIPAADTAALQATIRYHVGNALRDRLSGAQLEDLGLRTESPRERSSEKRERQSAVLALFTGGPAIADLETIVSAAASIAYAIGRIDVAAVRKMPAADRRAVALALETVCTAAQGYIDAARESARGK